MDARRADFIQGQFCRSGGIGPTCSTGWLLGFGISALRGPREGGPAVSCETLNPFSLLAAAASGGLEAQRTLAEEGARIALCDGDLFAAIDALCFARLAAANGDVADKGRLLSILAIAGDLCRSDGEETFRDLLGGEGLALVSLMADDGVEVAENQLTAIAEWSSPGSVAMAKQYRELMTEGK